MRCGLASYAPGCRWVLEFGGAGRGRRRVRGVANETPIDVTALLICLFIATDRT